MNLFLPPVAPIIYSSKKRSDLLAGYRINRSAAVDNRVVEVEEKCTLELRSITGILNRRRQQ